MFSLIDEITDEERTKYYKKLIQSELLMPFSPQSHQYLLFCLGNLKGDDEYKSLEFKIWERFRSVTKGDNENEGSEPNVLDQAVSV